MRWGSKNSRRKGRPSPSIRTSTSSRPAVWNLYSNTQSSEVHLFWNIRKDVIRHWHFPLNISSTIKATMYHWPWMKAMRHPQWVHGRTSVSFFVHRWATGSGKVLERTCGNSRSTEGARDKRSPTRPRHCGSCVEANAYHCRYRALVRYETFKIWEIALGHGGWLRKLKTKRNPGHVSITKQPENVRIWQTALSR